MTGRHVGTPVTLADADRRVVREFLDWDAKHGFDRAYASARGQHVPDEVRFALPPLAFEDDMLSTLIDTNKGFPDEPVRRTYGVLRELQVLRQPTDEELAALERARQDGFTMLTAETTFDVIDVGVFKRVFTDWR